MAGAYTVFANGGIAIKPQLLASIRTSSGDPIQDFTAQTHSVLDPRVAYLTTNMMEAVLQGNGTGAGVRSMGFNAPAAGKTGTENDSWFAGYTSNLLCIVWVGNDDYSDLKMQGAVAAAPIWANFMKRAVALPQYSDTHEFAVPTGVTLVSLDTATNLLADASCPDDYTAAFLDGTQPLSTCDGPSNDQRNIFQKIFGIGHEPAAQQQQQPAARQGAGQSTPAPIPAPGAPAQGAGTQGATAPATQTQPPVEEKKPGFFGKLFGRKPKQEPAPQPNQQQQPQP